MEWKSAQRRTRSWPNSTNNIGADVSMNGQKLEEVTSFKYLGAIPCKDGTCSAEIRIRIASAMAAMARLIRIWLCNTISFISKFELCKSLVTVILLYGCVTWTLLADWKKDPGFWNQVHEKTSPYLLPGAKNQRLGAEQDQLSCGCTGTCSGNCQETETGMVWACYTLRQPLQNLGVWDTLWLAEEMLAG